MTRLNKKSILSHHPVVLAANPSELKDDLVCMWSGKGMKADRSAGTRDEICVQTVDSGMRAQSGWKNSPCQFDFDKNAEE